MAIGLPLRKYTHCEVCNRKYTEEEMRCHAVCSCYDEPPKKPTKKQISNLEFIVNLIKQYANKKH